MIDFNPSSRLDEPGPPLSGPLSQQAMTVAVSLPEGWGDAKLSSPRYIERGGQGLLPLTLSSPSKYIIQNYFELYNTKLNHMRGKFLNTKLFHNMNGIKVIIYSCDPINWDKPINDYYDELNKYIIQNYNYIYNIKFGTYNNNNNNRRQPAREERGAGTSHQRG